MSNIPLFRRLTRLDRISHNDSLRLTIITFLASTLHQHFYPPPSPQKIKTRNRNNTLRTSVITSQKSSICATLPLHFPLNSSIRIDCFSTHFLCPGGGFSASNVRTGFVMTISSAFSDARCRETSVGNRVQRPSSTGKERRVIAWRTELLPELWSPMTTSYLH